MYKGLHHIVSIVQLLSQLVPHNSTDLK